MIHPTQDDMNNSDRLTEMIIEIHAEVMATRQRRDEFNQQADRFNTITDKQLTNLEEYLGILRNRRDYLERS